jgi:twinkle protein
MQAKHISHEEEAIKMMALKNGQTRSTCPYCSHQRRYNKTDRCLSIKKDEEGIVYNCQHCGIKGAILEERRVNNVVLMEKKPLLRTNPADRPPLEQAHYDWLKNSRGISKETADKLGLFKSRKFFPAVGTEQDGIGFPYFDADGMIVSAKIRSIESKAFTCWQSPPSFFNIGNAVEGEDFIIVEGEMDVAAMMEAGLPAVSVPNGAPMKVIDGKITPEEDKKFQFLWAAKDLIDKAKRVIIAVDKDTQGEALAEEIARRVGRDRCWRIEWPEGIKDANDYLKAHGKEALAEFASKPTPWPINGLYGATKFEGQIRELYEKGIGRGASTGYDNVDDLYTIVPGQMSVVTGVPSSGKSEFVDQIMVNLAERDKWTFAICSFENEPRLHIAKLMSKRVRKPFFEGPTQRMQDHEMEAALDWVNDHFVFLHQEDGGLSNLDSILERLRAAVLRMGVRGAVIDPYNFIDRPRDVSETEWISTMLTRIKSFCMAHGIHIWFVAHPTKLQRGQDGKLPVPKGYDISGSAAWFAKADCGMTVHRVPDENPLEAQIHIWKVRFSWVGKQGETRLYYDVGTTRYADHGYQPQEGGKAGEDFSL